MKINSIVLALILLPVSFVFAGENPVTVTLTNGSTFKWQHYNDTDDSYCTYKWGGQLCIQKKDVKSIVEIKDDTPKDAHVVYSHTKKNDTAPQNKKRTAGPDSVCARAEAYCAAHAVHPRDPADLSFGASYVAYCSEGGRKDGALMKVYTSIAGGIMAIEISGKGFCW